MYHGDNATQDDVEEIDMRPGEDPAELAVTLGFDITWLASRKGSRYTITSPDEYIFNSKAAAMKHFKNLLKKAAKDSNNNGDGTSAAAKKRKKKEDDKKAAEISSNDPPWRLDGHTLIGRKILYTFQHKASARRQIKIEQYGTIEGYIDESDTDKNGNPGFFSEKNSKPDNLFHISFDDNPGHPYAQYLLNNVDLEEYELVDLLLPQEEEKKTSAGGDGGGSAKKKRRRS